MRSRPARRALVACGLVAAVMGAEHRAAGAPVAVGLVGPPDDRLVDELGRELETARFAFVRVQWVAPGAPGAPGDQPTDPLAGVPADLLYGVSVSPDDRRVVVFARLIAAGPIHTRIEMQVDPRDRLARRRACIAVVEYLRVLAGASRQPSVEPDSPLSPARAAPGPGVPATTAPPAASSGPAEPPAGAATNDRTDGDAHAPPQRPRSMGVATTLDLSAAFAGATAHLQFVWRFPIGSGTHLVLRVRGLWPLVSARFEDANNEIRVWTFGAGIDLLYTFFEREAVVRPFLGVTAGAGLVVTDSSALDVPQSESASTPVATLGLVAGLSYRVNRSVALFLEVEAARDRLIPVVKRSGYEKAIADSTSLHSSIGALFEY